MKTLVRINIFIIFILLCMVTTNVKAKHYYVNQNNVKMTEQEDLKVSDLLSETRAATIIKEQIDKYIKGNTVDKKILYQRVKSNKNGIISEEYITEDEYNNAAEAEFLCESDESKTGSSAYIETTYKRFDVTLADYGNNNFSLYAYLTWKKVPACRSYDVFAFRLSHMTYFDVYGVQTYYVGSTPTNITYDSSSPGYKSATNGAGYSMNLKDDNNITKFEMILLADLAINDFNVSTAHVYTTYQHAITNVTRAQSMSYTFSAGGLGDVLLYSSTSLSQKYDDMAGIHLSTPV